MLTASASGGSDPATLTFMITRYRIVRGRRAPDDPLPAGERQDTRKHTRHLLRPEADMVQRFLADGSESGFGRFHGEYEALLETRFAREREAFDRLAERARLKDIYLGCNCPTHRQPDVQRCHTTLALRFLARAYPDLDVRLP